MIKYFGTIKVLLVTLAFILSNNQAVSAEFKLSFAS